MSKFGKIQNISGKTSTYRAENIFPKYLLCNVHEIAWKYPREKERYRTLAFPTVYRTMYQDSTARTGRSERESRYTTARTGQPGQKSLLSLFLRFPSVSSPLSLSLRLCDICYD